MPKTVAKGAPYPEHTTKSPSGDWDPMWAPRTVDVASSNRAHSMEKAKTDLGHSPPYTLENDLKETVDWYRNKGIIA